MGDLGDFTDFKLVGAQSPRGAVQAALPELARRVSYLFESSHIALCVLQPNGAPALCLRESPGPSHGRFD
jgi:hypothetical protein